MEKNLTEILIKYFQSLGIEVYTNTKARGHQGFFLKNRIDVSKNIKKERIVPTLLHEFAHYVHNKLEPEMARTGGSLERLFNIGVNESVDVSQKNDVPQKIFFQELLQVTYIIDDNSLCLKLKKRKELLKKEIKIFEIVIKEDYPEFSRSKKFKEFDKYIRRSKARYLLKYDRVKLISPFLKREEVFSIDSIEHDFPDIPKSFCAYIKLKSAQKKRARTSKRINYANKYYSKPTELFARFIEGLYLDYEKVKQIAPNSYERFFELLANGYYLELKEVFQLISGFNTDVIDLSVKYLLAQA